MPKIDLSREFHVRTAAMDYVRRVVEASGGVVTRQQLESFTLEGEQLKLIDASRGIRNPRQLAATLSILTSPDGPYDDAVGDDGLLRYAIRTGELGIGDNRKLQVAYEQQLPLIWLQKITSGIFAASMPVYLAAEESAHRRYVVAMNQEQLLMAPTLLQTSPLEVALAQVLEQRRYAERMTKQRLHQPRFRAAVMLAYRMRCSVCSLAHAELLDAAHIARDAESGGDPVVCNGLSLCKIHHAAYDGNMLGISPEGRVHIGTRILDEVDGPMLEAGLQAFHGAQLRERPRRSNDNPDPERLERRFQDFLQAN